METPRNGAWLARPSPAPSIGCFLVLGVPRGGTSVVAGLLRIAGLPMGELIDATNQEDLEFLNIGQKLRSANTIGSGSGDDDVVDARHHFRNLHDLRAACHGAWGFKDPTLIDYLGSVIPYIKYPRLICVFRDPVAVAMREEMARNSFDASLRLTSERQSKIISFVDSSDHPVLLVSYEKLLMRPWETFGVISRFVIGAVDDSLRELVQRYVVAERATATIENLDYESLGSEFE